MKRLLPNTIFAQLVLLIIVSVLFANIVGILRVFIDQDRPGFAPNENTGRLAALIELVDQSAPDDREALIARFRRSHADFLISPASASFSTRDAATEETHLGQVLGPAFVVRADNKVGGNADRTYLIRLRDGSVLKAYEVPPPLRSLVGQRLLPWLFAAFSLAAAALWSGWIITGPLKNMTRAVEHFRPETNPHPLAETGPYEVRALASAFNRMQNRIGELLTEKTNALAAVSHDLRTPITRMRLRAEFMTDTAERERMIHDLDVMDQLTHSALNYLKNDRNEGARERVDLASLVHTVANRFADEGKPVAVDVQSRPSALVHGLDVERALANLIENAFKYASSPCVRLREKDGEAVIEVVDLGPGIPLEQREAMISPFTRGDAARSMENASGFGMGLAIAREAIVRQGGRFELLDATPQGLLVRMSLRSS